LLLIFSVIDWSMLPFMWWAHGQNNTTRPSQASQFSRNDLACWDWPCFHSNGKQRRVCNSSPISVPLRSNQERIFASKINSTRGFANRPVFSTPITQSSDLTDKKKKKKKKTTICGFTFLFLFFFSLLLFLHSAFYLTRMSAEMSTFCCCQWRIKTTTYQERKKKPNNLHALLVFSFILLVPCRPLGWCCCGNFERRIYVVVLNGRIRSPGSVWFWASR
jgi:hypothetical protein